MMSHRIFVGNVPYKCTNEEFTNCFSNMEGFKKAEIARKYNSNMSRGFGFAEFEDDASMKKALGEKIEIHEREFRLAKYEEHPTNDKKKESTVNKKKKLYKIFVKDFSGASELDLKNIFNKYGEIQVFYIKESYNGDSYCVVGYESVESCKGAINDEIIIDGKVVFVKAFRKLYSYFSAQL